MHILDMEFVTLIFTLNYILYINLIKQSSAVVPEHTLVHIFMPVHQRQRWPEALCFRVVHVRLSHSYEHNLSGTP